MPFLTTALAVGGIASAVGGTAASIAGSRAQAGAAKTAAQLEAQNQAESLAFQEKVYNENVARQQPFLTAGTSAVNTLADLLKTPGEGLLTPWTGTFKAPTAEEARATPGYTFALGEGERALQTSAAASGGLLAGGTLKGIENYAQGLADTNYQNVFGNALKQYETAFNTFQTNQANTYNRLAGVAGTGQTTAAQLGGAGQTAATNVGNINLTAGANIGRDIMAGSTATASGYTGAANALTGGINSISSLALLQQILAQQQGGGLGAPGGSGSVDPSTGLPWIIH